jgi:pimeloyl-ACP methyl ester carboxylesterase
MMKTLEAIAGSFVTLCMLALVAGCGSGDDSATSVPTVEGGPGDAGTSSTATDLDAECPVVVSETTCDKTQRPIVFVHGTYSAGDNIMNVALLFGSNGYCSDRFVSMDYNSLVGLTNISAATNAGPAIDAAIDAVLKANPDFSQVDLMGHSQGAYQIYAYLQDPAHAAKVAHYVQLAGGAQPAPPGPPDAGGVPTLSISSYGDAILGPNGVTGAEKTVVFETQDHQAVCTSVDTFVAIWQYLHQGADGGPDGQYPTYTSIQCGDPTVALSGLSETFGDNAVPPGGKLEVYAMGSDPRDSGAPIQTFTITDGGADVSWQAKRLQPYEFRGYYADGGIIGHQYFAPFKRDNHWLRFLVPSQNPLAQVATNPVFTLNDDAATTIIARAARGAFRPDLGDSLTVNGYEALNSADATRTSVTVALFMYDANKDGKTEGGSLTAYSSVLPYFLRGTDVFVPSSPPGMINVTYDGKSLLIPNWPSKSQGPTLVTFE